MVQIRLWMEFAVLFGAIPLCYALGWLPLPKIPLLLTVSCVALAYLIKTKNLPKSTVFIQFREIKPYIRPIILRCLAVTAFSVAAVAIFAPSELFAFPRSRPLLWLAVMGLYPILSALPQELLYRAFLFARYPPYPAHAHRPDPGQRPELRLPARRVREPRGRGADHPGRVRLHADLPRHRLPGPGRIGARGLRVHRLHSGVGSLFLPSGLTKTPLFSANGLPKDGRRLILSHARLNPLPKTKAVS